MIPHKIHYCWFGKKSLPKSALDCISSWEKHMPNYDIKRWDETNFDVNAINYTKDAYSHGLYAFVSDYARFKILENEGGIYLDTDVEIVKPLDDIISKGPYMGIEEGLLVNPGLGFAAESGALFLRTILSYYENLSFIKADGSVNFDTVVFHITKLLKREGWTGKETKIAGFNIYPAEYFCPLNYKTKKLKITPNTHTIHHYNATWITWQQKIYTKIKSILGAKAAKVSSTIYKFIR